MCPLDEMADTNCFAANNLCLVPFYNNSFMLVSLERAPQIDRLRLANLTTFETLTFGSFGRVFACLQLAT